MAPVIFSGLLHYMKSEKRLKLLRIWLLALLLGGSVPALADYEAGVNAAFDGDFETAFREFTVAAEEGLDLAQYNLGILYYTGQGVARDFNEAYRWTLAAAEQGHVAAQFNLGTLYYEGQGVKRDHSQAVEWFASAGKAGHAEAAFELARMYEEGDNVKRDRVQAHAWASMAIANEHPDAAEARDRLERRLNASQLSTARRLFAQWQIE